MAEGHDYFDAVAAGDGVLVRMTENAATTLAHLVSQLVAFLEREETLPGHKRLLRAMKPEDVRRRMFPDACGSRAASDDFRARFREVLTDPAPAHRVAQRLQEPTPLLVPFDELEDWHTTMALVRALHLATRAPDQMVVVWTKVVQEHLIVALEPKAVTGWPN
ncbi:hypothetical protein LFM09_16705 [Lentzea alba]